MQHARSHVLIGFFLTISIIVTYRVVMTKPVPYALQEADAQYQIDKYHLKRRNLDRNSTLTYWAIVGVLSSACAAVLIIASGWHRAHVKQAKVHLYKIDDAEIWVHERDLSMAWQICTGLTNAKALERSNAGMQKAFELYTTMAEIQNAQMRAIVGRRGLQSQTALPASPAIEAPAIVAAQHVPTFAELMQQGMIGAERPLLFGFVQGSPRTGTWKDIYSNATGGQSGSGKTNTLRSIITQSVLQRVCFWVIDYHWPHPESLLASLGELRNTPYITYADKAIDVLPILQDVDATIDRRLAGDESDEHVKVLAIDEVLRIAKNVPYTEDILERIGTEGRKVNVLGLFSAQSWTADKISTTARDNLTSIFAHNMKRSKAYSLLQDSEQAKTVQKLHRGQMLFCSTNGRDDVLDVPFCTEQDVKLVANMVGYAVTNPGNGPGNVTEYSAPVTNPGNGPETLQVTGKLSPVTILRRMAKNPDFSISGTAKQLGINKGYLSNIVKGKNPSPDATRRIEQWLKKHDPSGNLIPFPGHARK